MVIDLTGLELANASLLDKPPPAPKPPDYESLNGQPAVYFLPIATPDGANDTHLTCWTSKCLMKDGLDYFGQQQHLIKCATFNAAVCVATKATRPAGYWSNKALLVRLVDQAIGSVAVERARQFLRTQIGSATT